MEKNLCVVSWPNLPDPLPTPQIIGNYFVLLEAEFRSGETNGWVDCAQIFYKQLIREIKGMIGKQQPTSLQRLHNSGFAGSVYAKEAKHNCSKKLYVLQKSDFLLKQQKSPTCSFSRARFSSFA
jgi:hypothetical protein